VIAKRLTTGRIGPQVDAVECQNRHTILHGQKPTKRTATRALHARALDCLHWCLTLHRPMIAYPCCRKGYADSKHRTRGPHTTLGQRRYGGPRRHTPQPGFGADDAPARAETISRCRAVVSSTPYDARTMQSGGWRRRHGAERQSPLRRRIEEGGDVAWAQTCCLLCDVSYGEAKGRAHRQLPRSVSKGQGRVSSEPEARARKARRY
jgi:hypothetical protein